MPHVIHLLLFRSDYAILTECPPFSLIDWFCRGAWTPKHCMGWEWKTQRRKQQWRGSERLWWWSVEEWMVVPHIGGQWKGASCMTRKEKELETEARLQCHIGKRASRESRSTRSLATTAFTASNCPLSHKLSLNFS